MRSKLATSRVALRKKHDDAQSSESADDATSSDHGLPLHIGMRSEGLGGLSGGGGGSIGVSGGAGTRRGAPASAYADGGGAAPASIFRSEPVVLVQLYLQSEVAHAALEELGEAGASRCELRAAAAGCAIR